ncbi:RagB/SusD family nutrient uptake outer membrane protein [Joostella sp.]|uniref:RagB/SusD family nutrient uptake outer membrane protein n=1 Tax=Joostella sp. TaxID=2231138 RepID=UPI003A92A6EE
MKQIKKFLIIGAAFFASCSDVLDQEPLNITHPDVFWISQSNAEQALAGAYGLFKAGITYDSNFLIWGEFPALTFMDSRQSFINPIENSGNYVLNYRTQSRDWSQLYRAANWAVTIESYVEEMPVDLFDSPSEKNRILGEAAFIRGLSYFYMSRIWGDVPIIDESIENSSQLVNDDGYIVTKPREDELKVLDYALEATNKAISLLEYSSPGQASWAITANKASAEALKTHITLWYASRDNDNPEMIQASIDAATSVIQNSGTSLIDYANEGKEGFDAMCIGQSKTGLFEINFDSSLNESIIMRSGAVYFTGLTLNFPIWESVTTGASPYMNPDFYGNDFMFNDEERENDARRDLFFFEYEENEEFSFLNKYSHGSQDPSSQSTYDKFLESNILIFRLADIYLLRAEAYAKQGKGALAVSDLNMIRNKANVVNYTGSTDKESLMKAIFDERAIELVGEGQAAYDRIRMNYFEGVTWADESRNSSEGYYWPISIEIISNNSAIVQTDYWQGKI